MTTLSRHIRPLVLFIALLPAACGNLPEPLRNNPGPTAVKLSTPPPLLLAVPPPPEAMLSDNAAGSFAKDLAHALASRTVPAIAAAASKGDWRLGISAKIHDGAVQPTYTVFDPTGKEQGKVNGAPITEAAWSQALPTTLVASANTDAPKIAELLTRIDARLKESNPQSLFNRPPVVAIQGVTGAPGDGDRALAQQMQRDLRKFGFIVRDSDREADYLVRAEVHTKPVARDQQRVEIIWIVDRGRGAKTGAREAGRVAQLHDVPTALLTPYWGEVAVVAASQAAGGIKTVIDNNIGLPSSPSVRDKANDGPAVPGSVGATSKRSQEKNNVSAARGASDLKALPGHS